MSTPANPGDSMTKHPAWLSLGRRVGPWDTTLQFQNLQEQAHEMHACPADLQGHCNEWEQFEKWEQFVEKWKLKAPESCKSII